MTKRGQGKNKAKRNKAQKRRFIAKPGMAAWNQRNVHVEMTRIQAVTEISRALLQDADKARKNASDITNNTHNRVARFAESALRPLGTIAEESVAESSLFSESFVERPRDPSESSFVTEEASIVGRTFTLDTFNGVSHKAHASYASDNTSYQGASLLHYDEGAQRVRNELMSTIAQQRADIIQQRAHILELNDTVDRQAATMMHQRNRILEIQDEQATEREEFRNRVEELERELERFRGLRRPPLRQTQALNGNASLDHLHGPTLVYQKRWRLLIARDFLGGS